MTFDEIKEIVFSGGIATYKNYTIERIYQSADGHGNHDFYIENINTGNGSVLMTCKLKSVLNKIDEETKN